MPSDANKHPNNATDKLIKTITLVLNTNRVGTNIKQLTVVTVFEIKTLTYTKKSYTQKNMNYDGCPIHPQFSLKFILY
jgi:hypothetical protein